MKYLRIIILLLSSPLAFAGYESAWIPMKEYTFHARHENVRLAIKDWAVHAFDAKNEKYDFKYAIEEVEAGFKARVTPLYIGPEGKYLYMIDGEMCLDLNAQSIILNAYQCAFPPL